MRNELKSTEQALSDHNILGKLNQRGFTPIVKSAMEDYAGVLQSRITDLEAELENQKDYHNSLSTCADFLIKRIEAKNQELIEALECVRLMSINATVESNRGIRQFITVKLQELKLKEG